MNKRKITLLEKIAVHSVDLPEKIIKFFTGDSKPLREISKTHGEKYVTMLNKVREYDGNVPRSFRDRILDGSRTCSKIRFYTACVRVRQDRLAQTN